MLYSGHAYFMAKEKKNKKKLLLWLLLTPVALFLILVITFKIYTASYYRANNEIISRIEVLLNNKVSSYKDKNGTVFIPKNQEIRAVIVFYPGGKVEYTAYSSLMLELASKGYVCLLPKMPDNLAFLKIDAVESLTKPYKEETDTVKNLDWYLAGHSLGGVAAATYLKDQDTFKGLILCASYTPTDYSDSDIRLLSIYGSNDKVLNMDSYKEYRENWPKDSREYVINGGIHSYFGSYGIQDGDGEPGITNQEQIQETADVINAWITQK